MSPIESVVVLVENAELFSHWSTIAHSRAIRWSDISLLYVASSFWLNCRPLQAKHYPQVDNEGECSKRVGSFKVEGDQIVVTMSWSDAPFCVWC